MKYVVVHIIKNKVMAFSKCNSKKAALEAAVEFAAQVGCDISTTWLWKTRHLPYHITEQSSIQIL